jgi:hypothetical protein
MAGPNVAGLSLAPGSAQRGPDLNEFDHKLSRRAEDSFAFDSMVR